MNRCTWFGWIEEVAQYNRCANVCWLEETRPTGGGGTVGHLVGGSLLTSRLIRSILN